MYTTFGTMNDLWVLGDSIFTVFFDINDIIRSFQDLQMRTQIPKLLHRYFELVEMLYQNRAREILFVGVPPFDRVPGGAFSGTKDWVNAYNGQLAQRVQEWAAEQCLCESHFAP